MARKSDEEILDPTMNEESQQTVAVPTNIFTEMLRIMQENSQAQLAALVAGMKEVAENLRKVPIDPIKEAQQKRAQKAKESAEASFWASAIARSEGCTHLRENGSSAIAWAPQSDTYGDYPDLCEKLGVKGAAQLTHITRGTCQHCQTLFSPRREECVSDAIHQRYADMRRIPTGISQSAMFVS